MDLTQLKAKTRALEIAFEGETLKVDHRPAALTGELVQQAAGAQEAGEGAAAMVADACCKILASWDLTDGGQPVPLTAAALLSLPLSLLGEVFRAVVEDCSPNATRGSGSFGS